MVANGVADWARVETMKSLARRAFLILEKAWKRLNVTLVDFKVYISIFIYIYTHYIYIIYIMPVSNCSFSFFSLAIIECEK
jgi:hypothetical protein